MSGLPQRGTTIARVRLHGGGEDPLAAQLRAAQVFASAGDLSDEIPAAAILCVRRIADPRPGQVVLGRRTAPDVWTRALRERVGALARRAARPARDHAADGEEAVIFADRAELLACLARDWCTGMLGRWWWRALVGDSAGLENVLRAWLETPTHVTASLHQAAAMQIAAPFVRRLPAAAVRLLLEAVVASHALSRLRSLPGRGEAISRIAARPSQLLDQPANGAASADDAIADAPWRSWVPEAAEPLLRRDQQLLLGVALAVVRAPVRVRTDAFADAVARWCADADVAPPSQLMTSEGNATGDTPSILAPPTRSVRLLAGAAADPMLARAGIPAPSMQKAPTIAAETVSAPPSIAVIPSAYPTIAPPGEDIGVTTRFAGVFYLLNVALALELYGDFTRPAARGLDLSIWDFVALAAVSLLRGTMGVADALDPPEADPVWALLATLAGRDRNQRPGAAFDPPDAWRIPPEWLRAFPERGGWSWAAAAGRLRVRHPAGFLVADVPRTDAAAALQVAGELAPYGADARRAAHPIAGIPDRDPLARWVGWLHRYLRARLARALGAPRRKAIGRMVCGAPGRIRVTATRVDVALSLADQPIAIRLAGLDREPGWIPAADRIVSFHFA
jgi:hypothetical protein